MEPLMWNGRSLFNRLICIILLSRQQNLQKFEVTTAKEINKCKMVWYFCAFEHLIWRNQPKFLMVWTGLEKYHSLKKEYIFNQFQKAVLTGKINYDEPLNKNMSNLKCFPNSLDITQFRNANDFLLHVVCYDERACQLTGGPSSRLEKKQIINSWKRHALCDSVLSYESWTVENLNTL